MANEKNLTSFKNRSKNERKILGRLGGIASGVSRRQKKLLKECMSAYMELCEEKSKKSKKEVKDVRLNVITTKSLHEDFKLCAGILRTSVNDLINKSMKQMVERHKLDINAFKEIIK